LGLESVSGNPATWGALIDFTVASLIMPIASLLLAVYVGWYVSRDAMRDEMDLPEGGIFEIWHVVIKYVSPVAIGILLVYGLMSVFSSFDDGAAFGPPFLFARLPPPGEALNIAPGRQHLVVLGNFYA